MSLHGPLRSLLLSWSEVTSLMTVNPQSGDYPIRPERLHRSDPLPAIEISQPDEVFEDDLAGDQSASESTVAISVICTDAAVANTLADAILTRNTTPKTGLMGFTGTAGTKYIDGVHVEKIHRGYAPLPDGNDSGEYVVAIVCKIWTRS
jgi:hypothetical protein